MGLSLYLVLDKEVPGFDVSSVDGKALARALPEQENIESPLTPLYDFLSQNPQDIADLMGDDDGAVDFKLPSEQWFEAEDGLAAIRAVLEQLPDDYNSSVVDDLRGIESALLLAQQHGARFHLAFDF